MNDIELEFKPQPKIRLKPKCTIHKNGRLGFNTEAIQLMNIDSTKHAMIAINKKDKSDKNLYIKISTFNENGSYKIVKAGAYYYLYTALFFNDMEIDYINKKIMYDVERFSYKGTELFKLIPREKSRKKKNIKKKE